MKSLVETVGKKRADGTYVQVRGTRHVFLFLSWRQQQGPSGLYSYPAYKQQFYIQMKCEIEPYSVCQSEVDTHEAACQVGLDRTPEQHVFVKFALFTQTGKFGRVFLAVVWRKVGIKK